MCWIRTLGIFALLAMPVMGADWPQWLGPRRDGSTSETVKPWKEKLTILWTQKVGEGHSSPIVAGGRVYLHSKAPDGDKERLQAFDASTGKQIWQTDYIRPKYSGLFGNGPRATPAVADGRVYTFGITGLLTCFDEQSGKQLWQVDTLQQFKAPKLFFGSSCSPLIEGNKVLINVGGPNASVVAFDAKDGSVLWTSGSDRASYASPISIGNGNDRTAVFLTQRGLRAVAVGDGKEAWQFPFQDKLSESSTTPVMMDDLVVASSITLGSVALRLEDKNVKEVWRNPVLTCYFSTPVSVGKELYLVTGTKPPAVMNTATLRCIDSQTGKELWNRPKVGTYHASLLRTGDNKLLMLEEKGDLVLLEPSREGYRELARSKICGNTWAHPAVSNGHLYIRDADELICVELPK